MRHSCCCIIGLLSVSACLSFEGAWAVHLRNWKDPSKSLVQDERDDKHVFILKTSKDQWVKTTAGVNMEAVTSRHVVVVHGFGLNDIKVSLISSIVRTSYPIDIVLGIDGGPTADDLSKIEQIRKAGKFHVVPMYSALAKTYGNKLANFLVSEDGTPTHGTGHLAWLEWFVQSDYDFAWGLEDDVWFPGLWRFIEEFGSSSTDLVVFPGRKHPFWAPWNVGSEDHLLPEGQFCYAFVFVKRVSKAYAYNFLRSLVEEDNSSHVELYYPYVVAKYNMSWTNMFTHTADAQCDIDHDHRECHFPMDFETNYGQPQNEMPCLEYLNSTSFELAHPVKLHCDQ